MTKQTIGLKELMAGANYRIHAENDTIMYTGNSQTGSWFTLEKARQLVKYKYGEKIMLYDQNKEPILEAF